MYFDLGDMGHDIVKHKYITIGMLAWLVMVPLALTSTKGMIRRLGGRRWNRLHQLTYAAAVFGVIHFFWGVKKDLEDPTIFAAIIAVLLGWRVWERRSKARRVQAV
jgi:sulfoxide reductase heme-binding subunit YedZ